MKKKVVCALAAILLLLAISGCGSSSLPSGIASRIDFTNGWEISRSTFEYVNEHTVRIVRESDGQVFYVPISSIEMIWAAD